MNDFNSEIVLGIITTVGTDTTDVIRYIQTQLAKFSYDTEIIDVSSEIIANFDNEEFTTDSEYERINHYMDLGNHIREKTKDATIIMQGVVAEILSKRDNIENPSPRGRTSYIIKSPSTVV